MALSVQLLEGFSPLTSLGERLGIWLDSVYAAGADAPASIFE
jgi:hypothetical protein